MKNLYLFLLASVLLCSCSQNDDSLTTSNLTTPTPSAVQPIAQYHMLNHSGNVTAKFFFDENGRFVESLTTNSSTALSYDSDNRIVNISTQDFDTGTPTSLDVIYDSEDRVLSIGERTFDYDETENIYTESIYYNYDYELIGNIEYVWNLHDRYTFESPSNPIPQYCNYLELIRTNLVTGEVIITGDCESNDSWYTLYENENVTSYGNESPTNLEYDTEVNPMLNDDTNLKYLLGFLLQETNGRRYTRYYDLISTNKKVHLEYAPEDPESNAYLYNLNSDGFPIDMTRQYFYVGQYEGEYLAAKYYYQGDDIPD